MAFSSQHHSFDIKLAAMYGIEEAVLIHHFQHSIRVNSNRGRNKEMDELEPISPKGHLAHFPYFTFDEVRRHCESLVEKGVLVVVITISLRLTRPYGTHLPMKRHSG